MEIRKCEPSFGMVRYGKGVEDYIRTMGHYKAIEFRVIGINNRENPVGIDLSLIKRFGRTRLKAQIGAKAWVENMFRNPICVLSKAVKKANKIYEHQQYIKEITKGMNIPRLTD